MKNSIAHSCKTPLVVSLYLEFYHFLGGLLFKGIGTGLLSSYRNQKKILEFLGIPYTEQFDIRSDVLLVNTPWIKSLYLIKKAKRRKIKVIIWAHVTVEDSIQVFRFMKFLAPLTRRYLTYAYSQADLILAPSAYTKRLVSAYGIPQEKIQVQSNGVNTEKWVRDIARRNAFRSVHGISHFAVGTLALVIPRKGTRTFTALAERFPDAEFWWFGKRYSSLIAEALPPQPSNAHFTGYIDDPVAGLNALDAFIFPSYEENQGMAVLEAASVGLPLIVRDIPVYEGWLTHGENCLKAKTDDEFAEHIMHVMHDESLRAKLSAHALLLSQHESLAACAEKLRGHFKDLGVLQ